MVDTPRKTFPELQALSAPVVDSDVLAVYRTPGPAKRTTASVLGTYVNTVIGTAFTRTLLDDADATTARATLAAVGTAALAATGGAALVGASPGGSGATLQTLQAFMNDLSVSVGSFGAVADGTTNNGAAFRNALAQAVALGKSLYIPPSTLPYLVDMVTVTAPIRIWGNNSQVKVTWSAASQAAGEIGGTYKASPAFLFKPGSDGSIVEGIQFTQDATFPIIYNTPAGFTSAATFAPVIIQRADYVTVRNCRFNTATGRGVYWRGGNYAKIQDNTFINSSIIMHIGETSLVLLWDASTVTTTRYSPAQPIITGNSFIGSNTTKLAAHSVYLTGANGAVVSENTFAELNVDGDGVNTAIYVYANDDGTFNQSNANISHIPVQVTDNIITGTVQYAIAYQGDTQVTGSDVTPLGSISNNSADVTGIGIYVEYAPSLRVSGNHIRSSSSPLLLADDLSYMKVTENRFDCTSSGVSNKTLAFGSSAILTGVDFLDNTITMPSADEFVMDLVGGAGVTTGFRNSIIARNKFILDTSVATARVLQLEASLSLEISENMFVVRNAALSGRYLFSVNRAGGTVLALTVRDNESTTDNATSYNKLGAALNSGNTMFVTGNDIGALAIACDTSAVITGNRLSSATTNNRPLLVESCSRVIVADNRISCAATNVGAAAFDGCGRTVFTGNVVDANTTSANVSVLTSGVIQVSNNAIENANSGVPYAVTGTGKIAGDLGALANVAGLVGWTVATLPAGGIMSAGATAFVSDALAPVFGATVAGSGAIATPVYADATNWKVG